MARSVATGGRPSRSVLSETRWQLQITSLAELRGWHWMHVRPAPNVRGTWTTPTVGTLGRGWPDLVLVRGERLLFVECKLDGERPTADQQIVLDLLGCAAIAVVWRPADWDSITEYLR